MSDSTLLYNFDTDDYTRNSSWAAAYDQQVMEIAKLTLTGYRLATFIEDTQKVTDGVVNVNSGGLVGMRVRDNSYLKYKRDFTIRARSRTGSETEIDKIKKGYGGVMVYCFISANGKYIQEAYVIDLGIFRDTLNATGCSIEGNFRNNNDGTALLAYTYSDFPKEMLIAHYDMHTTHKWVLGMFDCKGLIEPEDVKIDYPYHKLDNEKQVFFYEQEFYVLSNYSSFQLQWKGQLFQTSEIAYHWEKFPGNPLLQQAIKSSRSSHDAQKLANLPQHNQYRRPDWEEVKVDIMRNLLIAKVQQHEYVRKKLIDIGDREMIEDSWRDGFWGWGEDRKGKNMLGKLWMQIRDELRKGQAEETQQAQFQL